MCCLSYSFPFKFACEDVCPTTFPPIISLPRGREILAERDAEDPLVLTVAVRENDVTVSLSCMIS